MKILDETNANYGVVRATCLYPLHLLNLEFFWKILSWGVKYKIQTNITQDKKKINNLQKNIGNR